MAQFSFPRQKYDRMATTAGRQFGVCSQPGEGDMYLLSWLVKQFHVRPRFVEE
jgi:hypothetical protein